MDGPRFDALTRRLTAAFSRRNLLAALGAGLLAMPPGGTAASARCRAAMATCTRDAACCSGICARGRNVPIHQRNRCACTDGLVPCRGACVDIATDGANCGACGHACGLLEVCAAGACLPTRTCTTSAASHRTCVVTTELEEITVCADEPLDARCETSADCQLVPACAGSNMDCICELAIDATGGRYHRHRTPVCSIVIACPPPATCDAPDGGGCLLREDGNEVPFCTLDWVGDCDATCGLQPECSAEGVGCGCVIDAAIDGPEYHPIPFGACAVYVQPATGRCST